MATRKQRLRTLENDIRNDVRTFESKGLAIGERLIQIREEELYLEDGWESWNQYLTQHVTELIGLSDTHAKRLIVTGEVNRKLPESSPISGLGTYHLEELGRLAPKMPNSGSAVNTKDYSRINKPAIARVLKRADEATDDDKGPTIAQIRKEVDVELGIDRTAKIKKTKAKRDQLPEFEDWLESKISLVEIWIKYLSEVPAEGWTELEISDPGLAKRFAEVCENLAQLLRQ
tara:strand:+ start:557 stop:1249 length:693 start_codon:yes stop_codon:yes gene_type:complete